ncbi:GxxExxY protein [candidate division LCP-89 bacterium B3_LCP]|uniref:GxxExxY protein n=1 Tax=candidate division LCP-89 bacterium B3_LCP TaxID=2012998 RepID=A0A532V505_UNCL8|nr:MAG: GxxExxY protein [candidate division LCP-89 bacterium B3_LCP]
MSTTKLKYPELTEKIIGCAMEVHNTIGSGFQELIYQRALAVEFEKAGLKSDREKEIPIKYKGMDIGTRRVDFLVEELIMVELKAISQLDDLHKAQMINYLEAYKLEIGLLINFGEKRLNWKRFIKTHK